MERTYTPIWSSFFTDSSLPLVEPARPRPAPVGAVAHRGRMVRREGERRSGYQPENHEGATGCAIASFGELNQEAMWIVLNLCLSCRSRRRLGG